MAITCTVQALASISVGDAVCVVGFDAATYPTRPVIVARASAANLATSKTVLGVSRENKSNTQSVLINIAGDVCENAVSGLNPAGALPSRIVATDINAGTAADQCRLIRVDRPDGSEHVPRSPGSPRAPSAAPPPAIRAGTSSRAASASSTPKNPATSAAASASPTTATEPQT